MTRSLELADWVFTILERAAAEDGTTPAGWVAAELAKRPAPAGAPKPPPPSIADFLARLGRIEGTGEVTSEDAGRQFTDYLVAKRRDGTL